MERKFINKIKNTNLYLVQGDITQISTDAIMTAINSGGLWFGGIDRAIQGVAGDYYHSQAAAQMPLKDLQTIVAKGGDYYQNRGKFKDVIFVVDDLRHPVDDIVCAGLDSAHKEGYKTLLIPAIRMGVMAGVVEKTPLETVSKIRKGVDRFMEKYNGTTKLENLVFVVYKDPDSIKQLEEGFKSNI